MTDPLTYVHEMYAAFGRGELKAILDRVDPAITWVSSTKAEAVPWRGTYTGAAGVAMFFEALVGNLDFQAFEPRLFHAAGDTIVVLGRSLARVRKTGKTFDSEWAHVFGFAGDKLVRFQEFYDTAAIVAAFSA
jgi:ketosteroid isomerase-like protein